jgi:aspartate aminotransferase
MRAILSHVGAWAPKAEQVATAHFMEDTFAVKEYLNWFIPAVEKRLFGLYHGIIELKNQNYPIDVIIPQAAIYLTVCLPWKGKKNFRISFKFSGRCEQISHRQMWNSYRPF